MGIALVKAADVVKNFFCPDPAFGPDFDPDEVVLNSFGALAFAFPSCANSDFTGILDIPPGKLPGYDQLLLDTGYIQLSEIVDCQTGETSADGEFSLERVACIGSCALAPAIISDDKIHGPMTKALNVSGLFFSISR